MASLHFTLLKPKPARGFTRFLCYWDCSEITLTIGEPKRDKDKKIMHFNHGKHIIQRELQGCEREAPRHNTTHNTTMNLNPLARAPNARVSTTQHNLRGGVREGPRAQSLEGTRRAAELTSCRRESRLRKSCPSWPVSEIPRNGPNPSAISPVKRATPGTYDLRHGRVLPGGYEADDGEGERLYERKG